MITGNFRYSCCVLDCLKTDISSALRKERQCVSVFAPAERFLFNPVALPSEFMFFHVPLNKSLFSCCGFTAVAVAFDR